MFSLSSFFSSLFFLALFLPPLRNPLLFSVWISQADCLPLTHHEIATTKPKNQGDDQETSPWQEGESMTYVVLAKVDIQSLSNDSLKHQMMTPKLSQLWSILFMQDWAASSALNWITGSCQSSV